MTRSADELLAEPIRRSLWRMGWTALRPLQSQAILATLQTESDLILAARTAAGKTEAAFLPILSDISAAPVGSVQALYVGPLKALINDQFRRLEELCEYAEIPVHRWHGDVSADRKRKLVEKPGGVLLITPESLESLFVNRSAALSRLFHSLSFVVIDELHALLGSERGTQLRSQLFRLARYAVGHTRYVALSATIGDLDAAARWLRPDRDRLVQILKEDGAEKEVRYRIHGYRAELIRDAKDADAEPEWVPPHQMYAGLYDSFRGTKNLIFANSKSTVEELVDRLNELGSQHGTGAEFLIHHGSISKDVREETERLMQGARPFTTVCSSTLELGIDIGNVRAVGQIGPTWSVSSLVQRLGRSGRRDGEPHQMRVCVVVDPPGPQSELDERLAPELLQAIAVTELMLQRWVESPNTEPLDLSTLVQQTLSVIAETGGATAQELFARLVQRGAFRFLDAGQFGQFLRGMAQRDLIEQRPEGPLILGLLGERLVRQYEFYAAFCSPPEYRVLHVQRFIGMLSALFVPKVGDHLLLAGRRWQVEAIDHEREEIAVRPAAGRKAPRFRSDGSDIAPEIRQAMRAALVGTDVPGYLDATAAALLAEARRESRTAGLHERNLVPVGLHRSLWFPWTGTRVMGTLQALLDWAEIPASVQRTGLALAISGTPAEWQQSLRRLLANPPNARQLISDDADCVVRKWDEFVVPELLRQAYARERLDIPAALAAIAELERSL